MSDYDKLLAGLNTCAGRSGKCEECAYDCGSAECVLNLIGDAADALEQQRAEIDRLTAENRAKEQYIAEHMGAFERGTGTHAFSGVRTVTLKSDYP